jgi:hypothetical protein
MRDQKLGYWLGITIKLPNSDALKTQGLKQPVAVFVKNANQALALSSFPQSMCILGQRLKMAEIAACRQMGLDDIALGVVPAEKAPAVLQLSRDILQGKVAGANTFSYMLHPSDFMSYVDEATRTIYDTLMSAELVLCWTAFETLAGDLWEAALNTRPQKLASLAAKNVPQGGGKQEGKTVPLNFLERYGYDVKNRMGTILLEHRGPFQTLKTIEGAYKGAFPAPCWAGADDSWDNRDVKTTCAIRNLIVHCAGVVDKAFLEQCDGDSRLAYKEGDQLWLDAQLLSDLLNGLFSFVGNLIDSVDDWIASNPA